MTTKQTITKINKFDNYWEIHFGNFCESTTEMDRLKDIKVGDKVELITFSGKSIIQTIK